MLNPWYLTDSNILNYKGSKFNSSFLSCHRGILLWLAKIKKEFRGAEKGYFLELCSYMIVYLTTIQPKMFFTSSQRHGSEGLQWILVE